MFKWLKIALKTHEIAPFFKIFLGGACPQTPLAKARSFAASGMYIQNPRNFKVPPLRNPAYAPGIVYTVFYYLNLCKLYCNYGPRA